MIMNLLSVIIGKNIPIEKNTAASIKSQRSGRALVSGITAGWLFSVGISLIQVATVGKLVWCFPGINNIACQSLTCRPESLTFFE